MVLKAWFLTVRKIWRECVKRLSELYKFTLGPNNLHTFDDCLPSQLRHQVCSKIETRLIISNNNNKYVRDVLIICSNNNNKYVRETSFLFQRLSVVIQRFNSVLIKESFGDPEPEPDL